LSIKAEPPTAAARYRNSRRVSDWVKRFIRTSSKLWNRAFACVSAIAVPARRGKWGKYRRKTKFVLQEGLHMPAGRRFRRIKFVRRAT
jgi:hypothetical protein